MMGKSEVRSPKSAPDEPQPLTADELACGGMRELHRAAEDSIDGGLPFEVAYFGERPMIVNSHGDALVNQMPSGEPYFEPEIARYLASAATMQPRLLATIAAKDVRIEDAIDQLELLKTMTRKHGLDNVSLACSLIIQNLKAKVGGDEQD